MGGPGPAEAAGEVSTPGELQECVMGCVFPFVKKMDSISPEGNQ